MSEQQMIDEMDAHIDALGVQVRDLKKQRKELLEALEVLLGGIDEATFIAEERGEETYLPPDMDCIVAAEQAIANAKGESDE